MVFTDEQWCNIKWFNIAFSINVSIQENRFKLLQRWYLTPARIFTFLAYGTGHWQCWRFKAPHADYLRMWWSCSEIVKFWVKIHDCIEDITKIKLPMCPRVMLLLDFEYAGVVLFKELLAHVLTAASMLIAKF